MVRRMESRYYQPDGVKVTEIKEKADGFPVGPADASKILGMPRTTLFRYDGPDIQRKPLQRGRQSEEVRVYSDEALLRIAINSGRVSIHSDNETGMTMLSVENSNTLLNIEWEHAQETMNQHQSRGSKER